MSLMLSIMSKGGPVGGALKWRVEMPVLPCT